MSDSIKLRAVWASVALACVTVLIGGASFLLNAKVYAGLPDRVTALDTKVGDMDKAMLEHERWGRDALSGLKEDLAEIKVVLGIKRKGTP